VPSRKRASTKNAFPVYGEGFGPKKVVGEWVNTEKLYPIHPPDIVKAGEGMPHAEFMAQKIAVEGFDLRFSIPVKKVDNGTFILQGGHHRLEALRLLGYTEIPVIYDPIQPVWSAEFALMYLSATENPKGLNRFPIK